MGSHRHFTVKDVAGAHTHQDGAATFVLKDEAGEFQIEVSPEGVGTLLGLCLQAAAGAMEHDGMRVGISGGQPALSFRFGQDRWLSILLGPEDLHLLETSLPTLRARLTSRGPSRRH